MNVMRPHGTGAGGRQTWATIARNSANRAEREGRLTWTELLDAAASAVMAETDPQQIEEKLEELIRTSRNWQLQIIEERDHT